MSQFKEDRYFMLRCRLPQPISLYSIHSVCVCCRQRRKSSGIWISIHFKLRAFVGHKLPFPYFWFYFLNICRHSNHAYCFVKLYSIVQCLLMYAFSIMFVGLAIYSCCLCLVSFLWSFLLYVFRSVSAFIHHSFPHIPCTNILSFYLFSYMTRDNNYTLLVNSSNLY